MKETKEI